MRRPFVSYLPLISLMLYLSRFLSEAASQFWWWPVGAIIAMLGGLIVGFGLWRFRLQTMRDGSYWPLFILWVYILYPAFDVRVGAAVGIVALLAYAFSRWPAPDSRLVDGGVFLLTLIVYILTLLPGVLPADAGEFQLATAQLGVAHPPGYPLYTLVGWLFTRLNPANPMWATNFFSAVTMALAAMLTGRAARRITGKLWLGVTAALLFAAAASVWSTAIQASIRPLTAFFTALCLERLAAFRQTQRDQALAGFMLAFGLGLTHHPSLAFPGVFYAIFILFTDPSLIRQPRRWPRLLGFFALGFLPWIYLPLRGLMDAPLAPDNLATWQGFWDHVLARGFSGDLFVFRTPAELADRLRIFANILNLQWHPAIVIGAGIAAVLLLWRDWRMFVLLFGGFALHSLVTMTYRAPQTVEYLIPAYVHFALILTAGIPFVSDALTAIRLKPALSYAPAILTAILLTGTLALGIRHWPSFRTIAQDDPTRTTVESLLNDAPPDSVILASWHWATPLWTLQAVEGQRPDVEVIYVYPDGAEPLAETWLKRIEAELPHREVLVTSFYPLEFASAPYTYEPLAVGWQVRETPGQDIPADMIEMSRVFDNGLHLLGYRLDSPVRVGDTFDIRFVWTVDQPLDQDFTASVHFVNQTQSISNSDVLMPTSRLQPGDIIVTRHTLMMPPAGLPSPADHYSINIGAYTPGPDGQAQFAAMGRRFMFTSLPEEVIVEAAAGPYPTAHPRHIVFANKSVIHGFDWEGDTLFIHARLTDGSARTLSVNAADAQALIGEQVAWWQMRLGPWGFPLGQGVPLPEPRPGERYVPLGGQMVLSRVQIRPTEGLASGERAVIDVDLLAVHPLFTDDIVKIDLIGPDYRWIVRSDHVPAAGAVPTLKWLDNWRITDRHTFDIPLEAYTLGARAELVVYDHFTGDVLPMLDIELAREGTVIPLYEWTD